VLAIVGEIAEGLARAHETGLVHRDLKPSNILVAADDHVKIVDFGLAKLRAARGAAGTDDRTLEDVETMPGTVLGTVGYMSPEQARSEPVTAASDQFSFGCILYELLTGRRAFSRPSAVETLSAILRDEPQAVEELNPTAPAPLRWVVERCLAKNPRDRYVSTRDLARDLRSLREHSRELAGLRRTTATLRPRSPRRAVPLLAGLAVAALLGALIALFAAGAFRPAAEPVMRPVTFRRGHVARALFVPRSNSILYSASWDGGPVQTFLTLPDTKSLDRSLDAEPQIPLAFSEDGTQVLVVRGASRADLALNGTLAWWPALGGKPRLLLENSGWADWAPRSRRLAVVRDTGQERRLELRDADGKLLRTLFHTSGAIFFVRFSPDESWIAFFHTVSPVDPVGEVRIASVSRDEARSLSERFAFCRGLDWNGRTGEIWFTAGREPTPSMTLRAVSPSGRMRHVYAFPGDFALHSIAPEGDRLLLIERRDQTRMIVRRGPEKPRDLTWFDQSFVSDVSLDESSLLFYDGWTEALSGSWVRPVAGGEAVRLGEGEFGKFSPDGHWVVALTSGRGGPPQILLHPTGTGQTRRLTATAATHWAPAFAGPDRIVFVRSEGGESDLWTMRVDGSGARALGARGCDLPMANRTGDRVVCAGGPGYRSIFVLPIAGGAPRKLYEATTPARLRYVRFNDRGDRVLAVTGDRHSLTVDAETGALLRDEVLTGPEVGQDAVLYTAAISERGRVIAFSSPKLASALFLVSGLR
jgi:Tol biopolymer transport system component